MHFEMTDEETALIPESSSESHKPRSWTRMAAIILSISAVSAGVSLLSSKKASSSSIETDSITLSATIVASNEYGTTKSYSEYPWLSDKVVVEPHKYTTLSVDYPTQTYGNKLSFTWKVTTPGSTGETSSFSGSQIQTTFTTLGSHKVEVVAFDQDGVKVGSLGTTAHCVYVKREIRSLTEEDRENYLDAMFTMWKVGTKKGREVYGNDYTGLDRFTSVHAYQATGDIKCDHWHEGTGFMTHHLALSVSFESSLRAVDKRVTTPYWDFTIEGEQIYKMGVGPKALAEISPVFTDTWFGSADDVSHVVDSRWAHAPSQLKIKPSDVANSYGIIRAPWNNIKDRELVRHMTDVCGLEPVNKPVPTCFTHYTVMNMTKLSQFLVNIAGYGHGTMHVNTGGVFGECTGAMSALYEKYEDELAEEYTMSSISDIIYATTGSNPHWKASTKFNKKMMVEKYLHLEYFHIYRTLYRSQTCALDGVAGALSCPESCDEDTPDSECTCTCAGIDKSNDNANFDWKNLETCMYSSDSAQTIFQTVFSEEFRKDAITMFCSAGVKEGEMLESASPGDPLFWMIHPVLDKLLAAKRLAKVSKLQFGNFGRLYGFEDESWLDYSAYNTDEYYCEGHGLYDEVLVDLPLPQHLITAGDSNGDGFLSNIEFYEVIDPSNGDASTYIYDDFTWSHCDSTDALGDLHFQTSDSGESPDNGLMFEGGVFPSSWGGESFSDIKPSQTKGSVPIAEYRAAVRAGLNPGKALKKNARLPGSANDFNAVMDLLSSK